MSPILQFDGLYFEYIKLRIAHELDETRTEKIFFLFVKLTRICHRLIGLKKGHLFELLVIECCAEKAGGLD